MNRCGWGRQLTGLVLVLLLGGCSSTPDANSPVGMEYSGGTLVSVEAATFQQVWRAASAALDDADVTILDRQRIENGGKLDGRTPDLQAVRVTVRVLTENKTELRIRIDSLGNSELARRIYARFKIALGPTP
ncbi:MAG TPA: DUF3568 family protein [Verrucomicrobiota bacterium]|nr:hypothetical protein [Verrucomicrobiales bacterium]HRI12101.1 DUF3568 family protein [Verrucomicrobiota bacterium]